MIRFLNNMLLAIMLTGFSISLSAQSLSQASVATETPLLEIKPQFTANNPNIQYTGRIDFTDPEKPRFWAPGVYIKVKFTGTWCEIVLNDEVKWNKNHNYLEIVIDDTLMSRIQTKEKHNVIRVAEKLSNGPHTLLICKNTETNIGYLEFLGLNCQTLLPIPPKPLRKIEFIGNSITCGTGSDLSQVACGKGEWQDQHNAYLSYGPTMARSLNAQWHLSSVSGIGLTKSCCGMSYTMPQAFRRLYFEPGSPDWNTANYIPDVLTICLGQNDGIQDSTTFCSAYVQFIHTLRGYYPQAQIICLTSPMADEALTAFLKKQLASIVQTMNQQGDTKVHSFFFSKRFNHGCDNHPNLQEHQFIANELELFVKRLMHW